MRSDLERAAAAARLDDVRVVEDEAALLEAVVEVDDGAVEVGVELLIDGELDAVDVDDPVLLARAGVEIQAVGETAAAPPLDADAEHGLLGEVLVGDDLLDFGGGLFAQSHAHGRISLISRWVPGRSRRPLDNGIIPARSTPRHPGGGSWRNRGCAGGRRPRPRSRRRSRSPPP